MWAVMTFSEAKVKEQLLNYQYVIRRRTSFPKRSLCQGWEVSKETFSGSFNETFSRSFLKLHLEVSYQILYFGNFTLGIQSISRFEKKNEISSKMRIYRSYHVVVFILRRNFLVGVPNFALTKYVRLAYINWRKSNTLLGSNFALKYKTKK